MVDYAQTVRVLVFNQKIDFVRDIMKFLNLEGHQSCIIDSKVTIYRSFKIKITAKWCQNLLFLLGRGLWEPRLCAIGLPCRGSTLSLEARCSLHSKLTNLQFTSVDASPLGCLWRSDVSDSVTQSQPQLPCNRRGCKQVQRADNQQAATGAKIATQKNK